MSKKDINSLLNKGKIYVCQYVTAGCYEQDGHGPTATAGTSTSNPLEETTTRMVERPLSKHDHRRINQVLDHLFDFRQSYTAAELVEWVKYLICGRRLPSTFAKDVKQYDTTSKCCLVWIDNFVAYRCRTCALSLCMSICADCFLESDHRGHDFNMFRSQAGGACDCGDPFVMKPEGFCRRHQPRKPTDLEKCKTPPNSLVCIANETLPRLLHYLVLYLRENEFTSNKKANALVNDILIYLSDLGTLMQTIISRALIDPDSYRSSLKYVNKEEDLAYQHRLIMLEEKYKKTVQEIELSSIFPELENIKICDLEMVQEIESFQSGLKHETYLDEIIFWTTMNEFPSNLITFLLKMLPNEEYKVHFAHCFVKHYFRIGMLILYPIERFNRMAEHDIFNHKLANAVLHISVQLFSNENMARDLCENSKLLYVLILTLKFAICGNGKDFWGILKANSELGFRTNNTDAQDSELVPYVVSCDHAIMRYHRFWPLISDLNNLFTHKSIAFMFLRNDCLIDAWFELLTAFQAMNLNLKSTKADDTNQNYKSSVTAELEICSSQMWMLVSHLSEPGLDTKLTTYFIQRSLWWLKRWLQSISFNMSQLDAERCTFHLPLHRYFSVFLNHAVATQNVPLEELLPQDADELKSIMAHPLQTLIASYQIMANMWLSFGPHIRTQASNYMQPNFCNSTIDADLFLVQQCASHLDPDEFVELFFRTYGMDEHLNLTPLPSNEMDKNRLIMFLENGFCLFATIVGIHLNLGLSLQAITRKEIVALLAVSDKTHSQIHDMLPYRWGCQPNNSFLDILNDVAEYKSPEVEISGSLVQGYFFPQNQVWQNEYNPLFVLYRNAARREFQTSLERFATYAKQFGSYQSGSLPWAPFRIPPPINPKFVDPRILLRSKTLHAYFFSILYRSLTDTVSITQHLMSIVVHLLELSLIEASRQDADYPMLELSETRTSDGGPPSIESIKEFEFSTWYPSEDFVLNFITQIRKTELSLTRNKDKIKAKIIASLFNSLMPEEHSHLNLFSNLDDFGADGPIITIDHEDEEENVINLFESDNEDSSQPVINAETIAPMLSFYMDDEEISDVVSVRDPKDSDNSTTVAAVDTDDSSSSESVQPSSSKPADKKLVIKTKPFKFQLDINESMLTLLLKLHSKLSEKRDSFKTDAGSLAKYHFNLRIGDGPYFIGCLLKRFMFVCAERLQRQSKDMLDHTSSWNRVVDFVDRTRRTIWPAAKAASPVADVIMSDVDQEELQRAEKKRKALERKQQIMSKFCLLQNEFMKNNKSSFEELTVEESGGSDTASGSGGSDANANKSGGKHDPESENNPLKFQPKTYQCVICMDFGASVFERPFVQVILLQSSSILNNCFAYTLYDEFTNKSFAPEMIPKYTSMPITNEEYCMFKYRKTFAYYFERKVDRCSSEFALDSWLSSFNIGWCGGVHTQSCGHFMHMDCYQSYISSVYHNRDSNDLIEYSCPLCRKAANSMLPIIPNLSSFPVVQSRLGNDTAGVAVEILNLLSNCDQARFANTTEVDSKFIKVLAMTIEDVTRATERQYRNIRVDPCPLSLFLFLSSISRINLEYNVVLWRKRLPFNQNASCLVPLFHALSLNAKLVLPPYYTKLWAQITGVDFEDVGSQMLPYGKQVPLLIKDVSAILLQFLYALPFNIDRAYFLSIVQALLNLSFIQAIIMITFLLTYEEKMKVKARLRETPPEETQFNSYLDYIGFIVKSFDSTILDSSVLELQNQEPKTNKFFLETLAKACLPFLRLSSMIFHLLFNQSELPDIGQCSSLEEFSLLANYLCITGKPGSDSSTPVSENEEFFNSYINWIKNPVPLIGSWFTEFDKLFKTNTLAALNLVQENAIVSHQPRLLQLPKVYEQLFMFYHKRPCETCNSIPKDPSLCLICGRLICIRENCCRNGTSLEGVAHARKCGAGTALYLAINSSTIILIRGRKACAWGSVYLDEFGEEDRDLKRGRPLYLCKERYQLLEQQWLTHSFLNINKKWIYHKDSL